MFSLETYIEELKALVAIDSGHKHAAGTNAVADFFEGRFREMGLFVERKYWEDNGFAPFLTARNRESGPIDVLIVAHMDTVFPVGTAAERPFEIDENGIAHGPGCADCKAGCLLAANLLQDMMDEGGIPFSVCVALNSDEETGSHYSRPYFEELAKQSKVCLVFEPGRAKDEFVGTRKGGVNYVVKCHGIPAHAGVEPEKGASAILELAQWIPEIYKLVDYEAGTTINIGKFTGGGDNGSVPDYAEFSLNCRYLRPEAGDELRALLERMQANPFDPRTRVELIEKTGRPAMIPHEATKELIAVLEEVGAELGQPVEILVTGGGSDGNFISPFGVATLDGCGPCGADLHTDKEYLKVGSVEKRLEIMKALLRKLFG